MTAIRRQPILREQFTNPYEHQPPLFHSDQPHTAKSDPGVTAGVIGEDNLIGWQGHPEAVREDDESPGRAVADNRKRRSPIFLPVKGGRRGEVDEQRDIFRKDRMEADGRRERPVEFRKPILPELLHFRQCRAGIRNQRGDVDALTPWRERGEVAHAARQHVDRAVVIQPSQMMERHADLQDALIEIPNLTIFGPPQPFERLVLLEILAAIELGNPRQEQKWRRFVAG